MKIFYKATQGNPESGCYYTSNHYLLQRLKADKYLTTNIEEADMIYITENCGGLALFEKYPDKVKILQLVCSHPKWYCKLLKEECEDWNMWDERPFIWAPTRQKEIDLADWIIVYSKYSKKACMDNGVPANKVIVIPKGVEIDVFVPKDVPRDKIYTVLMPGQQFIIKGIQYAMQAYKELKDEGFEFKLVLCGDKTTHMAKDGTRKNEIGKLIPAEIENHGRVNRNKLIELYNQCDVVLCPSIEDSFNMVCLIPETGIFTGEGIKPIENIIKGDKVLTHKGRYKEVKEVLSRDVNEKLLKIRINGENTPITITKNHPILTIKSQLCARQHKRNTVCKPNCKIKYCSKKYYLDYAKTWKRADDLVEGDFLCFPRVKIYDTIKQIQISNYINTDNIILGDGVIWNKDSYICKRDESYTQISKRLKTYRNAIWKYFNGKFSEKNIKKNKTWQKIDKYIKNHNIAAPVHKKIKNNINLDKSFFKLLGYWLAEGSCFKGGISFAFNINEDEYIQEVKYLLKEVFGTYCHIRKKKANNSARVYVSSVILRDFFNNFYKQINNYKHKYLPIEYLNYFPANIEIFKGHFNGDGNIMQTGKVKRYSSTSISRSLIYMFKNILAQHDISSSIRKYKQTGFSDKICAYTLILDPLSADKIFSNIHKRERRYEYGWSDKEYLYKRIKKIEYQHYSGKVYNLEVNEDESYCTTAFVVHNCMEALSCDKPVICTENTGAGELLTHHKNGSIIPIRSVKWIKKEIRYWGDYIPLDCNTLASQHTMKHYMDDVINILQQICYLALGRKL